MRSMNSAFTTCWYAWYRAMAMRATPRPATIHTPGRQVEQRRRRLLLLAVAGGLRRGRAAGRTRPVVDRDLRRGERQEPVDDRLHEVLDAVLGLVALDRVADERLDQPPQRHRRQAERSWRPAGTCRTAARPPWRTRRSGSPARCRPRRERTGWRGSRAPGRAPRERRCRRGPADRATCSASPPSARRQCRGHASPDTRRRLVNRTAHGHPSARRPSVGHDRHVPAVSVIVDDDPAARAAAEIARHLADAVERRGRATLAVSGGSTGPGLLAALAAARAAVAEHRRLAGRRARRARAATPTATPTSSPASRARST